MSYTPLWTVLHFKVIEGEDECAFDDNDNWKADQAFDIGVYSSEEKAKLAIERLKTKPGFRDWPHGFRIYQTFLDPIGWSEGFVTVPIEDID